MNKLSYPLALLLALISVACSNVDRSRDLANPAVPAAVTAMQVCSTCHGMDGNSTSPNFPKLAGQQKDYFISQLKGFRSHNRSDPAGFEYMWGIVRNLSDAQIEGLADYYARQTPTVSDTSASAAGKAIFENGVPEKNIPACSACHGTDARGNGQFPRLAGQHADYLIKQLNVFQRTDERPEGAIMKTIAHEMSPENIDAVAAHLATLK